MLALGRLTLVTGLPSFTGMTNLGNGEPELDLVRREKYRGDRVQHLLPYGTISAVTKSVPSVEHNRRNRHPQLGVGAFSFFGPDKLTSSRIQAKQALGAAGPLS